MTVKGYLQSHMLDYYLGSGMNTPPTPNIVYVERIAPTVSDTDLDYLRAPNVLRFTFSEDVQASLTLGDLIVTGPGGIHVPVTGYSYNASTNTATFKLATPLADGNYVASFAPGSVTDYQGNPLASSFNYPFFALAGDANHDRTVDAVDLGMLSANWQGSDRNFAQGDFNYDGVVDVNDLAILSANWQKTLPAEGSMALCVADAAPAELHPAPVATKSSATRRTSLAQELFKQEY